MADALSTIRSRIKLRLGNKEGIDATITKNINEAILHLIRSFRPQEMWATASFNTVANTAAYTFSTMSATNIYAILMVRNTTSDIEIKRGGMRQFNRLKQDTSVTSTTGRPNRWTRQGNTFILYNRIPDAVYAVKVTYLKRPAALSLDADTFPLNDEWQRPADTYATYLSWIDLNVSDKAAAELEIFNNLMSTFDKPEAIEDEAPEAGFNFGPV